MGNEGTDVGRAGLDNLLAHPVPTPDPGPTHVARRAIGDHRPRPAASRRHGVHIDVQERDVA
jgi:hypothetical protein